MNSTFFFIEDHPEGGIDPIRRFVHSAEGNVRKLYHHLLFEPGCMDRDPMGQWGKTCAAVSETKTNQERIVLDIGANRGYYTLLSASYGHVVHAFDPQPHCASMLGMEILLNGFSSRVKFHHNYVSDETKQPMKVRRRTGCTGTFPNDNHDGWACLLYTSPSPRDA